MNINILGNQRQSKGETGREFQSSTDVWKVAKTSVKYLPPRFCFCMHGLLTIAAPVLEYNSIILKQNFATTFKFGQALMDIVARFTKVEKTIEIIAGMIVLENPSGFPHNESNLYLISHHEEIIWKAEKPDPYTFFSRVKLNEDGETFSAYTVSGHACEFELYTGKLISFTRLQ